jgi:hypothetical protein
MPATGRVSIFQPSRTTASPSTGLPQLGALLEPSLRFPSLSTTRTAVLMPPKLSRSGCTRLKFASCVYGLTSVSLYSSWLCRRSAAVATWRLKSE